MRQVAALFITLALTACACVSGGFRDKTPVVQPTVYGTPMAPEHVHQLMVMVAGLSRYPIPKVEPIVDVMSEAQWMKVVCPEAKESLDCNTLGYYIDWEPSERGVVHVRDMPADLLATIGNRSLDGITAHELTHYSQSYYGWGYVDGNCVRLAGQEMEAYEVEYLYDLGHGHARPFEMADILSGCMLAHMTDPKVK